MLSGTSQKALCYQKLFWSFTARTDCSSYLKFFANSWPSASNFKSFSQSLEHFFLTVGQNNFDNKIPKLYFALTFELHDCLFHKLTQGGIWVERIHILDQFANDFSIGFGDEFHSFSFKENFDLFVVGDDTIVNHNEFIIFTWKF